MNWGVNVNSFKKASENVNFSACAKSWHKGSKAKMKDISWEKNFTLFISLTCVRCLPSRLHEGWWTVSTLVPQAHSTHNRSHSQDAELSRLHKLSASTQINSPYLGVAGGDRISHSCPWLIILRSSPLSWVKTVKTPRQTWGMSTLYSLTEVMPCTAEILQKVKMCPQNDNGSVRKF